jgi:hypothetical protein
MGIPRAQSQMKKRHGESPSQRIHVCYGVIYFEDCGMGIPRAQSHGDSARPPYVCATHMCVFHGCSIVRAGFILTFRGRVNIGIVCN